MKKYNALLDGTPKAWDIARKPQFGGGGGGGESTTSQNIPDELKPLATAYTESAIDLSNQPYNPYDGQRYEDFNLAQTTGLDMVAERALGGDALTNAGYQNVADTLSGQYMNANPYLDQMYDTAADKVTDAYRTGTAAQTDAGFARAGNLGGSAYQQQVEMNQRGLGDSLSGLASDIYGGNYQQERANQLQAWTAAPQYGNLAYTDASQLLNAGQIAQDQSQLNADFAYEQYQEEENDPYKKLAAMSGVFGSGLGGSSTTQSSGGGK